VVPHCRRGKTLARLGAIAAAGTVGAFVGSLCGPHAASGAATATSILAAGDVVRVADLPVGCQVVRRGVPAATMLDCRRGGALRGTYGVLLGRWNVRVFRFESPTVARLVFTARHGSRAVCCSPGAGG